MTTMGWYVRVTTDQTHDGVYNTVLYIAGYPTPDDAIAAVRKARSREGERYEAVGTEILSGIDRSRSRTRSG